MKSLMLLGVILNFLLVPATLYVAAYYSLALRHPVSLSCSGVHYRIGGSAAEIWFRPIHEFDQKLRPHFWRSNARK